MIIKHEYERMGDSYDTGYAHVWNITITHNDRTYHVEIQNITYAYNVDYWTGHVIEYNEDGDEKLDIGLNPQDVYNNLSCMLIGIKEIIYEDFSNVDSSGFYHSNINDVISDKSKILNKISRKSLFDKIIFNKQKELSGMSKEELLKYLWFDENIKK